MSGSFRDKFLVASCIAGDEQAFAELYDRYVGLIYKFIVFRVSNVEDAQDLTSEVFLKTWQYISSGEREINNFRSLLYRISRNLIIDYYRSRGREVLSIDVEQWEKIIDDSEGVEELSAIKDDMRLVKKALADLSDEHRDLVAMKYIDDLSINEMAQALEKKSGTVRVALHRAIKELRKNLKNTQL